MRETTVQFSTDREEELVGLLKKTGMKLSGAKILVFLLKAGEAPMRRIERETDLRQGEVCYGMKELDTRGWIRRRTKQLAPRGRPDTIVALSTPAGKIIDSIEEMILKQGEDRLRQIRSAKRSIKGITE